MDWFSGYADADGCITTNEGNQSLQISSIEKEFLMDVKLMLQTCGINTKISLMRGDSQSYLPDGKGGKKYFDTGGVDPASNFGVLNFKKGLNGRLVINGPFWCFGSNRILLWLTRLFFV